MKEVKVVDGVRVTESDFPGGFTVASFLAKDAKLLDTALHTYTKQYHPMGYGTVVALPPAVSDGTWSAKIRRYTSAD
jgi:spore germination protein YaaH